MQHRKWILQIFVSRYRSVCSCLDGGEFAGQLESGGAPASIQGRPGGTTVTNTHDRRLAIDAGADKSRLDSASSGPTRSTVNWILAGLTVPGAAIVMLFALGAVMSVSICIDQDCDSLGLGSTEFGILFYGPPFVALAVITMTFFTARKPRGIVVPLTGWALLIIDVALLALAVAGR